MDRTDNASRFRTGDRVEVLTDASETWIGGFEIASISEAGCHVRRVCDGEVLPTVFAHEDVRAEASTPNLDSDSGVIREWQFDRSVILRLPLALDIATVEAIRYPVLEAVDQACGEVVLDLDSVEFLDSYGLRLLITARRRAWERDLLFRLHGGKPFIRHLLDLVGEDPLYRPGLRAPAGHVPID